MGGRWVRRARDGSRHNPSTASGPSTAASHHSAILHNLAPTLSLTLACRDERYFVTCTPPGSPRMAHSPQQQQPGGGSSSRWLVLQPPPMPWQRAAHAGSVRICLR